MRELINILIEETTKATIEQVLKKNGYDKLKVSGNKIAVLVQIPNGEKKDAFRSKVLQDVLKILQTQEPKSKAVYSSDPTLSSIGGIVFSNSPIRVLIKDEGKQGEKSAGVANEIELASILQSVIDKYGSADVTFVDPRGKTLTINNCNKVDIAGREVSGRKKADVVLVSPDRNLPISIKKLSAEAWESADNLFGKKARGIIDKLVDDGMVKLNKLPVTAAGQPVFALSKEIVVEPTEEEALDAIFGSDLNPKGGIVIQTFKPEHFVQDGNKVNVECHAVITTKEEIPESHLMVWLLRNDSNRNSKALGIPGIRIMAVTLTRGIGKSGKKDVILVDQKGNVVEKNFNPNYDQDQDVVEPKLTSAATDIVNPKIKKVAKDTEFDVGRKKR